MSLAALLEKLEVAAARPEDPQNERIKKSSMTLLVILFIPLAGLWSVLYYLIDLPISAAIPGIYSLLSIVSVLFFLRTKRYRLFRFSQILMMFLLPLLLQFSLGGFVTGSGVALWSALGPLGALTFSSRKEAYGWQIAFMICITLAAVVDSDLNKPAISTEVILMFSAMNICGVTFLAFALMSYFITGNAREHDRAENLLLNILPAPIAMRLKRDPSFIAEGYDAVTVLFADIANFTTLSQQVTPAELVGFLDDVFSRFDRLAEQYDLEKIKTIGDCYMLASGIPKSRADHATACADMALAMLRETRDLKGPGGQPVDLRIGINSGAVVAGVIGRKKFIYDLWGDAVNTASRMESHGVIGRIHVTRDSYDLLKNAYDFEDRGTLEIKGKGAMNTFLLNGAKAAQPAG